MQTLLATKAAPAAATISLEEPHVGGDTGGPLASPSAADREIRAPTTLGAVLVALWGAGGVLLLLAQALWRLTPIAMEAVLDPALQAWQIAVLAVWVLGNAYGEGYRAFQRRFSPRVVARALHLARHPLPLHVALAPLFCMGLLHARRAVLALAWGTTAMVIFFIATLHYVPQPWRGIIDAGVVVALAWGAGAIAYYLVRGLMGGKVPSSAELPVEDASAR